MCCTGVGKRCPAPEGSVVLPDGVEVPCGVLGDSGVKRTSLEYNEFVVYDVAQVVIRYLVRVKFHMRRGRSRAR